MHWKDVQLESFRERLKPLTPNQKLFFHAVERSVITLCTGPAGTGKSYMSCGLAAEMFQANKVKKIVLTRPLVTCGNGVGFLPGDLDEKVAPYMRPLTDAFENFFSAKDLERYTREGTVELWPLELMRGASIKNAVILCDEAQNAEFEQLRMLLTRFGEGSKVIVTGDASQSDIRNGHTNPLLRCMSLLKGHRQIGLVCLTKEDIVRHPLIQWIDERLTEQPSEDSWYDVRCPACKKTLWFNSGDESDLSRPDVTKIVCWNCKVVLELDENLENVRIAGEQQDVSFTEETYAE